MDENAVRVIVTEVINGKIKELWDEKVSVNICNVNHKEVREMKGRIDKIFVMFIAILTGIIVQIASALIK